MTNVYIIALVVLAIAGIFMLRYRNSGTSRDMDQRQAQSRPGPDFAKDREDSRLAHMSADDRAWETASLQRNQANLRRSATPAD